MCSEVDIDDIDGVGERHGELGVEWHEEKGMKEALFIDVGDDVSDKPILSSKSRWEAETPELVEDGVPIAKLH